ncbi:MAG: DNA polymerase III subunit gamma/tau [Parahaliea sp.]
MSYQALARKWRPKNFRELVGQEHVLRALINALDHDRLHHAYLFTGTRGVGKTTIARILAKCLNCEEGVSSVPCGQCSSCLEIAEGRSVDLLEVDAASRTKVEDTRELLENVQYAPTRSRYKVYLIDEVHMLSNHSFNALLKTLEEPPPHVKFLLATTDPQKLPATILSRCLQFNLKNMPPDQVVGHLKNVLDQESISYEEAALELLGRAAAGSMRDALSLTDQAIAFGSGKLHEADVRTMLGTVDMSFIHQVLEAVVSSDPAAVLAVVAHMAEHAPDFESALTELVSLLHRVAIAQAVPEAVDTRWGDAERVLALAAAISAEDAQLYYQMALNGRRDIVHAADPRSGFEMTLLRMLAFRPAVVFGAKDEVKEGSITDTPAAAGEVGATPKKSCRPSKSAALPATAAPVSDLSPPPPKIDIDVLMPEYSEPGMAVAVNNPVGTDESQLEAACAEQIQPETTVGKTDATISLAELTTDNWHLLLAQLGLVGIVHNIATNSELVEVAAGHLHFVLDENNASLFNSGHADKLCSALQNYFNASLTLTLTPGVVRGETPACRALRLADERQQQAVAAIENDPVLQQLIERFDGKLDRNSIAPLKS